MKKYVCLFKLWERVGFLITCVTLLILGTGRNCSAQSYYYDELNRLERIVYDDGSYITYSYDANGNIKNNVVENNEQDQEDTSKDKQDDPASENPQVIPDNNIENDPNDLKTDLGENNTENSSSDLESEKEKSIVGKKIKSKNATYEITSAGKIRTVALIKLNHKRYKNFVISDSIKYKGKSYKITKIADNA